MNRYLIQKTIVLKLIERCVRVYVQSAHYVYGIYKTNFLPIHIYTHIYIHVQIYIILFYTRYLITESIIFISSAYVICPLLRYCNEVCYGDVM